VLLGKRCAFKSCVERHATILLVVSVLLLSLLILGATVELHKTQTSNFLRKFDIFMPQCKFISVLTEV